MAYDKVIDSTWLEAGLKKIGDGIRSKTGGTANLAFPDEMDLQIRSIDTQEDLTAELSDQDSLIAQIAAALEGKAAGGEGGSEEEWIGDGNTHIWVHLGEGRTSPILGCCPNGTVTVDWGDGRATSRLIGTSTTSVKWTSAHPYAKPGDYVITLIADGTMGLLSTNAGSSLLRYSTSTDNRNRAYCNAVQKVELGNDVTSIGNYAFQYCCSLSSITIPESVTSIGNYAFQYCYSLSSITIPESVTSIGDYAFNNCCSLPSITIPKSVTKIGTYAFYCCYSLSSITIPESVTSIGNYAFSNCSSLPSITIPKSVTSIGTYAFQYCYSLSSITIPESVTSIGNNAFYNCCSLSSITIPESVTKIGNNAFSNCSSLPSITIPKSVTSIGSNAFYCCYSLYKIRFESTTPPTVSGSSAFTNVPTDCIISVPVGRLDAYTAATNYPSASTYTYIEED